MMEGAPRWYPADECPRDGKHVLVLFLERHKNGRRRYAKHEAWRKSNGYWECYAYEHVRVPKPLLYCEMPEVPAGRWEG
jgi:hypothetical protein